MGHAEFESPTQADLEFELPEEATMNESEEELKERVRNLSVSNE